MSGKFLQPAAIVDTLRSEQRTNDIQKRNGLTRHPVTVTSCGCPDSACGCWHTIRTDRERAQSEGCRRGNGLNATTNACGLKLSQQGIFDVFHAMNRDNESLLVQ